MDIEFTQFMMPDGRKKQVLINRPDEICKLAKQLVEKKCRLEIEMLRTGAISMTVEQDLENGEIKDLAHEICSNGPLVPPAIDKLLQEAITNLK